MLEALLTTTQKVVVTVLSALLVIVIGLSTIHMAALIGEEIWKQPRFLLPVDGLLEIFGFFMLILIGVELLETMKAYIRKDVLHVRVVIEVALIAMSRKVLTEEPERVPASVLFGTAALILALGLTLYFERLTGRERVPGPKPDTLGSAKPSVGQTPPLAAESRMAEGDPR